MTGSCIYKEKPVPRREPAMSLSCVAGGLLLGADAYLDGGENALVAFHLALVLAEFLDLGEGYVPLVDLYALGCERLCNLG